MKQAVKNAFIFTSLKKVQHFVRYIILLYLYVHSLNRTFAA